jgi:cytochrome oxidase Cu insertion factor (SCO1/SenC/PrrC family)
VKVRPIVALLAVILAASVGITAGLLVRPDREAFVGSDVPPGIMLPRFELASHTGRVVRSSALRGKVVWVTFLETKCKEACPLIADEIRDGMRELDADERSRVVALAISTHPGDDTRASVGTFLRHHRVTDELTYLVGSTRELRPVWTAFHVLPALDTGDADTHSAPVRIFATSGEWVSTLHAGVDLTPDNLVHETRLALR